LGSPQVSSNPLPRSGADRPRGETVIVAGAGLAGSLMAIYLARAGHRVEIVERRSDPRKLEGDRGRSINLAISTRGLAALERVGLDREVLDEAVPMAGRMMHSADGRLTFQPYGTESGQAIHSVSRLGLNIALIDVAEREPGVTLRFDRRCVDVDLDSPALTVEDALTGRVSEVRGDRLIGADGAFSVVRGRMQRLDRFDYSQSFLGHGYKELTIPAAADGGFRMERNALHIWPRGGFMMIALPNADGSFTCTLFWPFGGRSGFDALRSPADVRRYFESTFADAVALMPDLTREYFENPTSSLVTVRCRPWHCGGRVALIGDACHAVVPFYGQGANAAFEDCLVLDECLREHAPDWKAAFESYEQRRKPNVDALADLAIANFIEMRDHVASRRFLAVKKLEKVLHRLFPRRFVPLYSMVTFSRIPYAEAVERARRQWRAVRRSAALAAAALAALLLLVVWWMV
jgi:kynurenine 3-monooxygenase